MIRVSRDNLKKSRVKSAWIRLMSEDPPHLPLLGKSLHAWEEKEE